MPDYTTLCRRQKTLVVQLGGRPSSGGLRLLVDSTGIKMAGEGEWKTRKHGASYRRQWRKVHLGIDAGTLDIRAIEVTTNAIGDAPTLSDLLAQIPQDEQILSVGGDGAYDTRACHAAIAERGADAVIPVRRNGQPSAGVLKPRHLRGVLFSRSVRLASSASVIRLMSASSGTNRRILPLLFSTLPLCQGGDGLQK